MLPNGVYKLTIFYISVKRANIYFTRELITSHKVGEKRMQLKKFLDENELSGQLFVYRNCRYSGTKNLSIELLMEFN